MPSASIAPAWNSVTRFSVCRELKPFGPHFSALHDLTEAVHAALEKVARRKLEYCKSDLGLRGYGELKLEPIRRLERLGEEVRLHSSTG